MTDSHTTNATMEDLLQNSSPNFFTVHPGDIITGHVIAKDRGKILVDIGGIGTGIISGKELNDMFQTAKNAQIGDEITAFVLQDETDEGMVILSLRKAAQMKAWEYFQKVKDEDKTIEVVAEEANKGGLMVNANGVRAFLPVSQLAPKNYPRVNAANAQEILEKLQKLIGQKFTCKIILLNNEETNRKLVVSERAALQKVRQEEMEKLNIGDIVTGEINGIVKFGCFVTFGNLEGLVHISELTWARVNNPTELHKIGDEVQVKVIGIEGEKISLSMKALMPDPWKDKVKNFPVGSVHNGKINRVTNFGVFVTLSDDMNGLVHTSEFTDENVIPEKEYSEGQEVEVKVVKVLEEDRSLGLSFKALLQDAPADTPTAPEKKETEPATTQETEIESEEVKTDEVEKEPTKKKKNTTTKTKKKKDDDDTDKTEEKEDKAPAKKKKTTTTKTKKKKDDDDASDKKETEETQTEQTDDQ